MGLMKGGGGGGGENLKKSIFGSYRSFSCFSEEWLAAVVVGKERVTSVGSVSKS